MPTTLVLTTYRCPACNYRQNFDPGDVQLVTRNFPEYPDLPLGKCPSCWGRHLTSELGLDLTDPTMSRVSTDEELAAETRYQTDAEGNTVLEQTGEREVLGIVNGAPAVVTEPVYEPKQRELTTKELSDFKLQRDQSLDELEAIVVKEVTEPPPSPKESISRA